MVGKKEKLQDYLHKPDMLEEVRRILQEFYQVVKACDADEQFVFMDNFMSIMMNLPNTSPRGFAGDFYAALKRHDLDAAMKHMQTYFASIL